jgi:hypothetical protein
MALLLKITKEESLYKQCVYEMFQHVTKGQCEAIALTWCLDVHEHKVDL